MVDRYAPTSLAAALDLMAHEELVPYAGGTDLMVDEALGRPFVFLHGIEELKGITDNEDSFIVGAGVTYRELLAHPATPELLKEAVAQIAAPAIRNTATLAGNIANASPKGDGALVCFAADAEIVLRSAETARRVPIASFYEGRGKTVRRPDELVTAVIIPKKHLAGYRFEKVGARKALAISRVSFVGLMTIEESVVAHLALAFGAVEDVVARRPAIDAMLIGKTIEAARGAAEEYLAAWDEAIQPIRGRVSAEYRKQVCLNLARDFITCRLG
ncbi:MAG: FAD binding domain-containing protein [Coriobacteriales bacterium]|jgi:CO/xanthine dehydrogenase FAD-binding subunit|nr:FAD binding domain-containing protein [Coriobacteriales bacterium]